MFASLKKNTTEIAAIAARLIDTSLYRPLSPHCAVFVRVLFAPWFKQAHTDVPKRRLAGKLSRYCIKPRPIRRTDVRRKHSIYNSLLSKALCDDELGLFEPRPL